MFEKAVVTQSAKLCTEGKLPMVQILENGKDAVTYVNMTAEKAAKVVNEHIKGGKVVAEYTL